MGFMLIIFNSLHFFNRISLAVTYESRFSAGITFTPYCRNTPFPSMPPKSVGENRVASTWMSKQAQSNHGRASEPVAIFIISSRGYGTVRGGRGIAKGAKPSSPLCPGVG